MLAGAMASADAVTMGKQFNASGELIVSGPMSVFDVDGALIAGAAGHADVLVEAGGALTTAGGSSGLLDAERGEVHVNDNGILAGTGIVRGNVTVTGSGQVSPGLSPGTIIIEGNYAQGPEGTLQIEFAGLAEGLHDVLHVTGDALIEGMLELFFIDSFVPQVGDVLNFLRVDGELSGQFSQILFPQGLWTLELVASFDDGMFGFEVLAVNEIAAAARAIPEPSMLALLGLGGLVLFGRRRRVA